MKIEVYYNKGGMNYFHGKVERRGYYVSVVPVELTQCNGYQMESFMAFSGVKVFLLEVGRKSDKAYNEAVKLAENEIPRAKELVLAKVN